ncbi:contact-dependent growth inhibition system immunity protein [Streptomyces sp. Je 1-332]|uniref:contact-dependent growth inhibition system immunity protein n=1 Tax=Streptomyces sp. Je 1-332 TaxID=3231270 RepID=UPI00345792B5
MSKPPDRDCSLEQLEGRRWPEPPTDATPMVQNVHELRHRPIGALEPHELARLITQDEGLSWLLPLAVEILRETAPQQAAGGWFDDDLLYAVVSRKPEVWAADPDLARELKEVLAGLHGLSRYVKQEVEQLLRSLPENN